MFFGNLLKKKIIFLTFVVSEMVNFIYLFGEKRYFKLKKKFFVKSTKNKNSMVKNEMKEQNTENNKKI